MATKRITLSDGTKLVTASTFNYVTFIVTDDSRVIVHKRTDSPVKSMSIDSAARSRGYCRVVTVNFRGTDKSAWQVMSDSANGY